MAEEQYDDSEPDMHEENVYKQSARDELVENDEISPEEEGFMAGYDSDEEETKESEEE